MLTVPVYNPKKRQERKLEKYFVDKCNRLGLTQRKIKWIGRNGAPDRLLGRTHSPVFPVLIELKDEWAGRLEVCQEEEIRAMEHIGFKVFVAYSKIDIDNIIAMFL